VVIQELNFPMLTRITQFSFVSTRERELFYSGVHVDDIVIIRADAQAFF